MHGLCENGRGFSAWSDAQLGAFFRKNENRELCGRFRAAQLDRPLTLPYQPQSRLYRWVLAAGVASITLAAPDATARNPLAPPHAAPGPASGDTTKPADGLLRGIVMDETGQPVIGASLRILEAGPGWPDLQTDQDGRFTLELARLMAQAPACSLSVSFPGYMPHTVPLSQLTLPGTRAIFLKPPSKQPFLREPVFRMGGPMQLITPSSR